MAVEARIIGAAVRLVMMSALLAVGAAASFAKAGAAPARTLYAVNASPGDRGSISVYDIDRGHRLIKTIRTVPRVGDVRGVAASAATGKLYVAYRDTAGVGMLYCLDLSSDRIVWNKAISPGVDRLAISPDGTWLYMPTGEYGSADFINVVDARTGTIARRVTFSNHSHDTQYPLAGPVFQTTKATDGSGRYLYRIDPKSYAVSRLGPYEGILGPYAVDGASRHVVNNVTGLWGMQIADLKTGAIVTARVPDHPPGPAGLLHGIGWTPDQSEVWESGGRDPHVYVWNMRDPMTPVLKGKLPLRGGHGSRWLTFTIKGDYGYVALGGKNSGEKTEIFAVRTHEPAGAIASSDDMLEIDFAQGKISQTGDQFGIGRRRGPGS